MQVLISESRKEFRETQQEVMLELKIKESKMPEKESVKELKETEQEVMLELKIKTNDFLKKFKEQKGKRVFGI